MRTQHNTRQTEHDYVNDMIEYCEEILNDTKGLDQELFFADRWIFSSTLLNLIRIGWAAHSLPRSMFDLYPSVNRKRVVAVGYILEKHRSSWDIKDKLIWLMIQDTIPKLLLVLKKLQRSWQKSVEDIPEEDRVSKKVHVSVEA